MKRLFGLLFLIILLPSCSEQYYQKSVVNSFDTVITITSSAASEQDFNIFFDRADELIRYYHQLFDAYNEYDGFNNIATINSKAANEPIIIDSELLDLLLLSKELYHETDKRLNIALGSVTSLWREAGEEIILPSDMELQEASKHTDINNIVIDEQNTTVYLSDPDLKLDVGGIAKGYAAQRISETLRSEGYDNFLLSMGGNIVAVGNKDGEGWTVGIENPDTTTAEIVSKVILTDGYSLVVSGDYLRSYEIDGMLYGHIIDPITMYPPIYYSSVAVLSKSSSLADAFSTAIFTLNPNEGLSIIQKQSEMEAMLITKDGDTIETSGFNNFVTE